MKKIPFLICTACVCAGGAAFGATETVNWYVDRALYNTTTCQSGGDIVLPTAPTKTGYTFGGWQYGQYDLSTLNTATNGDLYYAITDSGDCRYRDASMSSSVILNCSDSNYSDLTAGKWKTKFSYGTVYGISKCSASGGTYATSGNPVSADGANCWCKSTGFVPSGEDMLYEAVSLWVFNYSYSSTSDCASDCAYYCGLSVQDNSAFRAGLFGSVASN